MPDTLKPTSATVAGTTTDNYNFGSSGATLATVNTGTNLTITGATATSTATITAPVVTAGESVANYATALTNSLTAAGIVGVTATASNAAGQLSITGSNFTTSGSVIQDPVASANATGTLSFDANGDLVSPAANIANISFAGLSDGAATMKMSWDILGSNGSPIVGQVDASSSTSAATQNGYGSGSYQGFSIASNGTVTASYSNGQTQNVGQLALANVTNIQGFALQGKRELCNHAGEWPSFNRCIRNRMDSVPFRIPLLSNPTSTSQRSSPTSSSRSVPSRPMRSLSQPLTPVTQDTINMVH